MNRPFPIFIEIQHHNLRSRPFGASYMTESSLDLINVYDISTIEQNQVGNLSYTIVRLTDGRYCIAKESAKELRRKIESLKGSL